MQHYNRPFEHINQHGFTPGKGTTSCWTHIHSHVLNKRYIYEFDLTKFFDTINLDYLNETLSEMGYPYYLICRIDSINQTIPQTPPGCPKKLKHEHTWSDSDTEYRDKYYHSAKSSYRYYEDYPTDTLQTSSKPYCYYHRVSQGSPLSPTLSRIILDKILLNLQTPSIRNHPVC